MLSITNNNFFEGKIFNQPKAFYLIFFIELWERFGYYGLQAIITIYMIKQLGMLESESITLFSSFSALVYGWVIIGGWLGDRILGTKRVIILGIIILATGYSLINLSSYDYSFLYLGMATIAVGTGLFKANPSTLLAACYKNNDRRIDGAFTMFYMSINIGSFISILITPWLAAKYGWHIAFSMSLLGMLITLLNFIIFKKQIKHIGSNPDFLTLNIYKYVISLICIIILIMISTWLLYHQKIAKFVLNILTVIVILFLIKESLYLDTIMRKKMFAALLLVGEAVIFFILYMQIPTSLNFFTIHNVHHVILGIKFEPEQFQALNPMFIMLSSPILTRIYNKLGNRLSIPYKFAIGMMLCCFSFIVLYISTLLADRSGIVSVSWLVFSYALQSVGELMISGLGLAMISRLISKHLMGLMMGSWFLTTAGAALIAGEIAKTVTSSTGLIDPKQTIVLYNSIFMKISFYSGIISILMFIFAPIINQMSKSNSKENTMT